MSIQPVLRSTRAAIFAAVCVTLATVGHALAAQTTVSAWAMGAGFLGTYGVAWVLTGAERSLLTIMGGLLGGQFVLHSLFTACGGTASGTLVMDHATGRATAVMPGHGSAAMTFAHVVAAVLSAWWLRRGERAAWSLARRVAVLASRPLRMLLALLELRSLTPIYVTLGGRTAPKEAAPRARLLRHSVIRRGPPFVSTVLIGG